MVSLKSDFSEWATPMFSVNEKDGSVCCCGDFNVTLNPVLEVDQYPLPRIGDIFAALSGGTEFSKVNLKHVHLLLGVDIETRPLLTIHTEN